MSELATDENLSIPEGLMHWASAGFCVARPSGRIALVVDGRKVREGKEPELKIPGGRSDDGDLDPATTFVREHKEETGISVTNPVLIAKIFCSWVKFPGLPHWYFIFRADDITDAQFDGEIRDHGMEGEFVDSLTAEQILQGQGGAFVRFFFNLIAPELRRIAYE